MLDAIKDFIIPPVACEPFVPPSSAEALAQTASLLQSVGRSSEMLVCSLALIKSYPVLSLKEVELVSAAFKCAIERQRTALRFMKARVLRDDESPAKVVVQTCEADIKGICEDALVHLPEMIEKLPPPSVDVSARVLLHSMIGDHYRYLCDVSTEEDLRHKAEEAYNTAATLAEQLPVAHPLRLGLALNRSILAYEVMKSPDQGVAIARLAFDESTVHLDALSHADKKRAMLVLDRLRENVSMWTENDELIDDEHLASAT